MAFTPAVESALWWFDATHEAMLAEARWRRVALPGAGGVGDQDARLMDALDLLRRVHNDIMRHPQKT